ncbi:YlbL family protein [Microbacterium dauci]|uniref:endopeptidase La n=1 Tax=Microbacterium dauci TaxID=3048008 RepID=A0ABT6ZBH2_9MICO|nr:PDZ domain-containing protein [Microbacterium sp. LX3-4]MDJ1113508.1 PDZ domain-containing protein [Microbacterium sp. LX3-4]
MSLFDDVSAAPEPRRRRQRRAGTVLGIWSLAVALVALLALTFLPTAYVIQQQGPVVNTLGSASDADGEEVPLISVEGADTYPAEGSLDLTTVQVVGNRERTPSWFELAMAWFDTSKAVLPIEQIYPVGTTTEQRNEESAALMVDSQKEATAAALTELGYDVSPYVAVFGFSEDSPAAGVLEEGDVVVSANGTPIETTDQLRGVINAGEGDPVTIVVRRDGDEVETEITPRENVVDGTTSWIIGVTTSHDYDFPIDVTIQLDRIGGPSAGQMFALGIIDVLTPGDLTGGVHIAGTGTIDAAGTIGPIGGIRQKLHGADDAGAEWFFAPVDNCDEVVGHIPGDLRVVAVETLADSLDALEAISSDEGVEDLPTCR